MQYVLEAQAKESKASALEQLKKTFAKEKEQMTLIYNEKLYVQTNQIKALLTDRHNNIQIITALKKKFDELTKLTNK